MDSLIPIYTNTAGRRATKVSVAGNVDSLVLIYTIKAGTADNVYSLIQINTINAGTADNVYSLILIYTIKEMWTHS